MRLPPFAAAKDDKADAAALGALEHGLQLDGAVLAATVAKARDPVADILRGGIGDEQRERLAAKLGICEFAAIAQEKRAEGAVRGHDDALAAGQRHRQGRTGEQGFEGFVEASGRSRRRHQAEAGIAHAREVKEARADAAACGNDLNRDRLIRLRDQIPEPGACERLAAPGPEQRPGLDANRRAAVELFEADTGRLHRQILGNRQRGRRQARNTAPGLACVRGLRLLELPDKVFHAAGAIQPGGRRDVNGTRRPPFAEPRGSRRAPLPRWRPGTAGRSPPPPRAGLRRAATNPWRRRSLPAA